MNENIESILQGPLHERAAAEGQATFSASVPVKFGLKEFAAEVHDNAVKHGWWDEPRSFPEIIALCHSELSEALEEYRNGRGVKTTYYSGKTISGMPDIKAEKTRLCDKPEGVPTELADCIIRILDYCGKEGIDIERALVEKHVYNQSRPYRHGGKKC